MCYLFGVKNIGAGTIFSSLEDNDKRNVLLYIFSSSASLIGFVLAAGTFLVSHVRDDAFVILRQSKSYPSLIAFIASAIWRLFGLTGAILLMLVAGSAIYPIARLATFFFFVWATLSLTSLTWIVVQVLSVPTRP